MAKNEKVVRILHLEDSPRDAAMIWDKLTEDGLECEIFRTTNRESFEAALERDQFDVILCDYNVPNYDGLSALRLAREKMPELPVILISGSLGEEEAVQCLHQGATDYLLKERLERLAPAVRRALHEAEEARKQREAAVKLRESEERFRQITENVADLIALLDLNGRRVYNNPAYRQILSPEDTKPGNDSFKEIHPEDQERIRNAFNETVQKGVGQRTEYRVNGAGGAVRYIESHGSVIRDDFGKITNVLVVGRDITERKRIEQLLRESEARTRLVIDTAFDAVITLNEENRITSWNHKAEELFGWRREEMIGQELPETIIPARFRGSHSRRFKQALEDGSPVSRELELTAFNRRGEEFPIVLAIASYEVDGKWAFSAFIRDISERKKTEGQIREQAALLDKARDAIIVRDLQQHVVFWNQGAERLYGWKAKEVVGKSVYEFLYREVSPLEEAAVKALLERGEWTGELKQCSRDGKAIIVESRRTLLRDVKGNPQSVLVINTDVTEKRQLEEQFLRAQRMETIGALAGGVAHDLNNVLAPIMMASEMLQDDATNEFTRTMLETIRTSAQRGSEIVRQILSFARGSSPQQSVVQIKHLVKESVKLAKQTFPRTIEIRANVPNDLWPLKGDATQVDQVLMNLLVNARDAMGNTNGSISIKVENCVLANKTHPMVCGVVSGRFVALTVADSGCGIAPEALNRIFEPFFTTKELGKGTGLGLSTVATILKAHQGFVEVTSSPGKGAEFKVYFPAADATGVTAEKGNPMDLRAGNGEWILLVDDEQALLEMSRVMLESYNYHVITANNGAEALRLFGAHSEQIQVVITDMMMPGIGGAELLRAVRARDSKTPVIVTTGLSAEQNLASIDTTEIAASLTKPFKLEELLSAIHRSVHSESVQGRDAE